MARMKKTALIMGVNGFCGRFLIKRLKNEGSVGIVGAGRGTEPPTSILLDEYIQADATDLAQVDRICGLLRPDFVFNLVGSYRGGLAEVYRTNLNSALCILEAVKRRSPKSAVILVGSAAEYGDAAAGCLPLCEESACRPATQYGISKYAMTLASLAFAKEHHLKVAVARPFNIVGPGVPAALAVGALLERLRNALSATGEVTIKMGNLDSERDFISVVDVADGLTRMALRNDSWGQVFNLCSGEARPLRWLVEQLLTHTTRQVHVEVDATLLRPFDPKKIYGSWQKANRAFGFAPEVPLAQTLRESWLEMMQS